MNRRSKVVLSVSKTVLYAMAFLSFGAMTSCSKDAIEEGDANYWTSSRGQFTMSLNETTTMFFLDNSDGTAVVTFDGDNPRHWKSSTNVEVNVETYKGDIIIPESVNNNGKTLAVTAIGDEAFMGCRLLTSVVIPETVGSIGQSAFNTTSQTSATPLTVIIPSALTEIPSATFANSKYLKTVVTAENVQEQGIILPAKMRTLGKMAFYGVLGVKSITLNDGLQTIGEKAFYGCNNSSLNTIAIPSTVETIGANAFGGTSKIRTFNIKAEVPPVLLGDLFTPSNEGDYTGYSIHVPAGCLEKYQTAEGWKIYKDIIIDDL